ncbi:MAG: DUF4388 domain-containing protein [Thermoanaerobaculales bacterium]
MTIRADIEDLAVAELMLMLALNRKTGRLTIEHDEDCVKAAFRDGAIVYAASTGVREAVGAMLVRRGLITDQELEKALEEQQRSTNIALLGNILADMGALSRADLEGVVYIQFQNALREALSWKHGSAIFEVVEVPDLGAVHVDAREIVLEIGLSTEQLVLDGVAEADADAGPVDQQDKEEAARLMLADLQGMSLAITSEMAAVLLGHAARLVGRAVLFAVYQDVLSVVGGFGLEDGDSPSPVAGRILELSSTDSVFSWVIDEGRSYRGRLKESAGNRPLMELLGEKAPAEVVAVPVIVDGQVTAVLYGDAGPGEGPIGSIGDLERAVARVAREMVSSRKGKGD